MTSSIIIKNLGVTIWRLYRKIYYYHLYYPHQRLDHLLTPWQQQWQHLLLNLLIISLWNKMTSWHLSDDHLMSELCIPPWQLSWPPLCWQSPECQVQTRLPHGSQLLGLSATKLQDISCRFPLSFIDCTF